MRVILFPFLVFLIACSERSAQIELSGAIMGTTYSVKVVSSSELSTHEAGELGARIKEALSRVDKAMSTYRNDSELMQFNGLDVGSSLAVGPDTYAVLKLSKQLLEQTEGYFDPSVGPLVSAWGFGASASDKEPDAQTVSRLLEQSGLRGLGFGNKDRELVKLSEIYIDLSAVAKGFAVDQVAFELLESGYNDFMVEVGGEVRTAGSNADGAQWRLGIEVPDILSRKAYTVAHISGVGMATSGDYRNFIDSSSGRRSHTINPVTGYPMKSSLASATVIMSDCASADAWATAFMAMGADKAIVMADRENIAAYFIMRDENGFESVASGAMRPYLKAELESTSL